MAHRKKLVLCPVNGLFSLTFAVSACHVFTPAKSQEHFPFSQNFQFEILEIFCVKRKGFFHASEKLAISLVDSDGTRSWCKREQIREQ